MINIAITGAAGRMGCALIEASQEQQDFQIVAAVERAGSGALGKDAGTVAGIEPIGVAINTSLKDVPFDILIDFTRPDVALDNLEFCRQHRKKVVIGTTGFDDYGKQSISEAGQEIAIVFAPNMSMGINLCFRLIELAAQALGNDVDVEIIEAHHRQKIDAPSGTALQMGEVVAKALGRSLKDDAVFGRKGITDERASKTIGFSSIRAGDIVGDHTVMFAAVGERVEITHRASSRLNFARGALHAAKWLQNKDKGLFNMQDVLNLK